MTGRWPHLRITVQTGKNHRPHVVTGKDRIELVDEDGNVTDLSPIITGYTVKSNFGEVRKVKLTCLLGEVVAEPDGESG